MYDVWAKELEYRYIKGVASKVRAGKAWYALAVLGNAYQGRPK